MGETVRQRMLTQKDIAQAANLSRMTVYRYLMKKKVSARSRRRIEQVLQQKGYRKNLTARSLVLKRTNLIGLLVPSVQYSFYPTVIEAIQQAGKQRGYNLLLAVSNEDPAQEKEEIDLLLGIPVDGLLIIPTSDAASEVNCRMLVDERAPFVMVDRFFDGIPASSVVTDSSTASRHLVQHLIDLGHRRIAHIGGPSSNSFARGVREGYGAALRKQGIGLDPDLMYVGAMDGHDVPSIMQRILATDPLPTAIQAVNDINAIEVHHEARRRGIRIPDDLSLVGFSDIDSARYLEVPLTTAREDARLMGREAARILFDIMKTRRRLGIAKLLPARIVVRQSTAPPRGKRRRGGG